MPPQSLEGMDVHGSNQRKSGNGGCICSQQARHKSEKLLFPGYLVRNEGGARLVLRSNKQKRVTAD